MAYAWDKIQNALKGESGSDIGFGLAGDVPSVGLSSTSQDGGGGGGSSGGGVNVSAPPRLSTAGSRNIIKANRGKASSPVALGGISNQIKGASQGLQDEANAYVNNATQPYKDAAPSQEQLHNWATGGEPVLPSGKEPFPGGKDIKTSDFKYDEYKDIPKEKPKNWYDLTTSAPLAPSPITLKTDTNIPDVSLLGSDAGIGELYRREGGPRYTSGMGALDTSLLRGDSGFNTSANEILSSYKNLGDQRTQIADTADDAAFAASGHAQNLLRDEVRGGLNAEAGLIENANRAEASNQKPFTNYAADIPNLRNTLKAIDPEIASILDTMSDDELSQMVQQNTTPGSQGSGAWEDYLDPTEASNYNRIMSYLGYGANKVPGSNGWKDASLDNDGLLSGLRKRGKNPTVGVLPGEQPNSGSGSGGSGSGYGGAPVRVGTPEQQPGSPNEVTVDMPGVGPTTITMPISKPTEGQWKDIATDVLSPVHAMNKEGLKDLSIPEGTWQGKAIKAGTDITQMGGPGQSVSSVSAPAIPSFPGISSMLDGGSKPSYNGDPANMEGLLNMGLPAGGTPTYSAPAPAPIVPNTPTVDFGGGYGSSNAAAADPNKLTPERKKEIEKTIRKAFRW